MFTKILQKICYKGADLVICQHSHCIGSREDYGKGTIIYGQGNFIFNSEFYIHHKEFVKDSLLISVEATKDTFVVSEVPIVVPKGAPVWLLNQKPLKH